MISVAAIADTAGLHIGSVPSGARVVDRPGGAAVQFDPDPKERTIAGNLAVQAHPATVLTPAVPDKVEPGQRQKHGDILDVDPIAWGQAIKQRNTEACGPHGPNDGKKQTSQNTTSDFDARGQLPIVKVGVRGVIGAGM